MTRREREKIGGGGVGGGVWGRGEGWGEGMERKETEREGARGAIWRHSRVCDLGNRFEKQQKTNMKNITAGIWAHRYGDCNNRANVFPAGVSRALHYTTENRRDFAIDVKTDAPLSLSPTRPRFAQLTL